MGFSNTSGKWCWHVWLRRWRTMVYPKGQPGVIEINRCIVCGKRKSRYRRYVNYQV